MLTGTVGVAPSTTTLVIPKTTHSQQNYWNPYASPHDLKNGLGIIDPNDWWVTGLPYGLPGTTTIYIPPQDMQPPPASSGMNGLGIIDPNDWWVTGLPYGLPGTTTVYIPPQDMQPQVSKGLSGSSGLGIIPGEITRTLLGPDLGAIPTDFELGTNMGYTPVHSGWIYGRQKDKGLGHAGMDMDTGMNMDDKGACMRASLKNQRLALKLQFVTTISLVALAIISIHKLANGKE